MKVKAQEKATRLCSVRANETWSFAATGRWRDGIVRCGPEGYRNFPADILAIRPRCANAPFFSLIGEVKAEDATTLETFVIGAGCVHKFKRSGQLIVYANDAPKWYFNNHGEIEVEALLGGLASIEPKPVGGLVGAWQSTRALYERTLGIPLVALLAMAACYVLAFTDQGTDLLRMAAEDTFTTSLADGLRLIAFAAFLLFLAIQLWFWPRTVIESNYGLDRKQWKPAFLLEWAPRALGVMPFLVVIVALRRSGGPNGIFVTILAVMGLAFLVGLYFRQDARERFRSMREKRKGRDLPPWPFGRAWVLFTIILAVVALCAATIDPVYWGRALGGPAVVFLGLGVLIALIITIVQVGAAMRLPITALTIAWIVIISPWAGNHAVGSRHGVSMPVITPSGKMLARMNIDQAYLKWKLEQPKDKPLTMIVIASEGGASRAGYWTAEVLGQLHDQSGGTLAQRTFAISSVSGGSVGAVGYVSILRDNPKLDATDLKGFLGEFAGRDALSPTLAAIMFPDLLHQALPLPFLPDRAQALEQSFETAWREGCAANNSACTDRDFLAKPFLTLAPTEDAPWRPIILVGGASEETGRRILTSTVSFEPGEIDADDFHTIANEDVSISTAIHNGARFPFVSPAGTLPKEKNGTQHIVDGGYFDSSGTGVLGELARYLRAGPAHADQLRIVYVFIGYDEATRVAQPNAVAEKQVATKTSAQGDGGVQGKQEPAKEFPSRTFLNELLGPLWAVLQSRSAHSAHLMAELKLLVQGTSEDAVDPFLRFEADAHGQMPGDLYVPIMICDTPKNAPNYIKLPLDWSLSQRIKKYMRDVADPKALATCTNDPSRSAKIGIAEVAKLAR